MVIPDRLSVLHVQGEYFPEGGAETYLRGLVAAQRALGHRVGLLYNSDLPAGHEKMADEFFCPPSFGLRSGLRHRRTMLDLIQAWQPQIIHLHVTQYRMSPLLVRALSRRLPTVHTVHDTLHLCFKGISGHSLQDSPRILPDARCCLRGVGWGCIGTGCVSQLVSRDGWRRALHGVLEKLYRVGAYRSLDRLLVNSRFSREELLRNGFPDKRIAMTGIATAFPAAWESARTDATGAGSEPPLILFVGKLVQAKGVNLLLQALEKLAHRSWQAVLVGGGPEAAAIGELITRNGWTGRVRVEPTVARGELGHFYRRARLVVFPSLWPESLGLVGVEAMQLGCPVVAFDSGAVSEWLENGVTGYLVPWGDVALLADRIGRLLAEADLAESMGRRAREKTQRFFRLKDHTDRVVDIYREVLAERGTRSHGLRAGRNAGA